ncbi:hypothetical protein Ddye_017113 [Dipteronia dyeriana]|uniref:Reverse transcriptase domain-containing protein n=1 Tax=Dipteronia dyeriana TaxID=168575 RepID=A0AAD9U8Y3_9ROSI|nr:hypothetical protein Ddye_017113 [Dipteronia dyeriana]
MVRRLAQEQKPGSNGLVLQAKVKATKLAMKRWLALNPTSPSQIGFLQGKLEDIDKETVKDGWTKSLRSAWLFTWSELWKGIRNEEQFWKQKSRVKCLKDGDRNSKFLHFLANDRKSRNFISDITFNGVVCKEPNDVRRAPILKVSKLSTMGDFRPISLVGSMYKVVAKVLANRIKKEVIHKWRKSGEGGLLVKLDFEKAYDNVDHSFLEEMLVKMGFGSKWRNWIKSCISIATMSILVNSSPSPPFRIRRGLRQGDPLSSFIFNIIVEGLSSILNKAVDLDLISGECFNEIVRVLYLQFTDDTIVFLKPKEKYLVNLKRILWCFELSYGLKINFHKSCVVRVGKKVIVGKATKVRLWQDVMMDLIPLKLAFPRIYALDVDKEGFISDNGMWNQSRIKLEELSTDEQDVFNFPWKGWCPSKIEIFAWQLLRGRVLVADILQRFDVGVDSVCKLCNKELETLNHTFIHCDWSWKMRNDVVFNGKEVCVMKAMDMIKFRMVWWFKHFGPGSKESVDILLLNLTELCMDFSRKKVQRVEAWTPPLDNTLKFNVDGSALDKPDPVGIRGVLRDNNGKIICMFSFYVGVQDSNSVKVLAIHKAVDLCCSTSICVSSGVVF